MEILRTSGARRRTKLGAGRVDPMTDARFWLLRAVAAHDGRLVAAALGPYIDYLPAVVSATLAP